MGTGPNITTRSADSPCPYLWTKDSTLESDQLVRLTWHHFKCKARTACVFRHPNIPTSRRSYFWDSLLVGEYEFIIIRNRKNNWFFWRSTFLAFINIKSSNIWQFYVHFDAVNVLATKDMILKLLMVMHSLNYRWTKTEPSAPLRLTRYL